MTFFRCIVLVLFGGGGGEEYLGGGRVISANISPFCGVFK